MRRMLLAVALVAAACAGSAHRPSTAPTSTAGPGASSTGAPSTGVPSTASSSTRGSIPSTSARTSTVTASPGGGGPADPCRGARPPATYQHVVVIVMENRGLEQVAGSPSAPYLDRLAAQCGLATDYSGVAHPSLPNYIAMTSGSTHGITDDASPSTHPLAGPSIFSLLGTGWRSLEESMPSGCDHASGGTYAAKHNPAVYYTSLGADCPSQDVPMDDSSPDIAARYTFITPNLCDDGHDCATVTADRWLSLEVPKILSSPEYVSGTTAVFIVWDENDAGGTLVPLYVIAPSVRAGTRATEPFNHYSLLRTTEELLGLTPLLGEAAGAPSMRDALHL